MSSAIVLTSVALLVCMGVALTYFGYELSRPLLTFAGTVGGILGGFALGVGVAAPVLENSASSGGIAFLTMTLVLAGGLFGYILVPALGRLAFAIAGFVATLLAGLVVLTEGLVLDALIDAMPGTAAEANPVAAFERFTSSPVFDEPVVQQALLLALLLGFVGAALAMRYYDVVATVAITGLGAAVMAASVPLLFEAFDGDPAVLATNMEVGAVWFLLFFATGMAFQFVRYRQEIDVDLLTAGPERPS